MTTLTLRSQTNAGDTTKNSPLTNTEIDNNFIALKTTADAAQSTANAAAPLNSPALTGNPTTPNQSAGTNNTRIANTAYADASSAAAVAAIPNATTSVAGHMSPADKTAVNTIPNLAPLASPAFTGNPTVPNRSVGDNTANIANTAYVVAAIAANISAASTLFSFQNFGGF